MSQDVLYRSPHLKVFRNGLCHARSDVLVVCFQYKLPDQHLDLPGFAEDFFGNLEIDAVFVNCATNEWYQYPDLPKALSALRVFASAWSRTVTYGSSMGGYAALRFAAAVGAKSSIAVGPQYSPRSAVVAGESRYDAMVSHTEFLYEDTYRISAGVDNYVIYDPLLKSDGRHVMAYQRDAKLVPIRIPCGGHTPTILLAQCGMLSEFILHLVAGTFCASRFRSVFRQVRTSSPEYWRALMGRLLERSRREAVNRVAARSRVHEERDGRDGALGRRDAPEGPQPQAFTARSAPFSM